MNTLFPIFVKAEQLHILIVGGGYVGLEKLTAVLANSPAAHVTLVAPEIRSEIPELCQNHPNVSLRNERYQPGHLDS
jgi:precorrin-2 dehydrogenase/sirohydrochlorin ferrochelatase